MRERGYMRWGVCYGRGQKSGLPEQPHTHMQAQRKRTFFWGSSSGCSTCMHLTMAKSQRLSCSLSCSLSFSLSIYLSFCLSDAREQFCGHSRIQCRFGLAPWKIVRLSVAHSKTCAPWISLLIEGHLPNQNNNSTESFLGGKTTPICLLTTVRFPRQQSVSIFAIHPFVHTSRCRSLTFSRFAFPPSESDHVGHSTRGQFPDHAQEPETASFRHQSANQRAASRPRAAIAAVGATQKCQDQWPQTSSKVFHQGGICLCLVFGWKWLTYTWAQGLKSRGIQHPAGISSDSVASG